MRKEMQKRKLRLQNGEIDPLEENDVGKDPRDIELSKK